MSTGVFIGGSIATRVAASSKACRSSLQGRRFPPQCYRCVSGERDKKEASHSDPSDNLQSLSEVALPDATWSLKDLELTSSKDLVSEDEFHRLAQKSLLDVRHLDDPISLRRELSNMLHCLEQIKKVDLPELNEQEIYDVPRGVTTVPLRSSSTDELKSAEEKEAKKVWECLLMPKTQEVNGSRYFAAVIKREKR